MAAKKITPAQVKKVKSVAKRDKLDQKMDKQRGIKQGSKKDLALDKKMGVYNFEYGKGKNKKSEKGEKY